MKKIFTLALISFVSFAFAGCGKNTMYETPSLMSIEASKDACKNLVIFIGDGMGPEHVKAGELAYNKKFDFTSWKQTVSDTYSYNSFSDEYAEITDSAAGGTAIATGVVTLNGAVGKDPEGNDLATILDYAKSLGKSVGVVTTDSIVGATPADFSAHALDRSMSKEIIDTQLTSNIDLFIGQYDYVVNKRKSDIEAGGYTYYSPYDSISDINSKDKVWCQFDFEDNGGSLSLKEATEVAVNYLSQNKKGYVLMVEEAHIDKNSHNNDFEPMIRSVSYLNDTVDYVKSTADNDTGIIITADHETGGLLVSKEDLYQYQYKNISYRFTGKVHTGTDVPLYVYGFDVDFKDFSYFDTADKVKNKDIFNIALYAITGNKYSIGE